ncbi:helicase HerA-like domain-containing protein [Longispora albida]|uniref:helicase HerA-like domain-containing protein n=1 Tax=Longispora albida TaxID=203523 RepID=UPI00038122E9|nr:helicase HerA-like domain-containing protein [Longispora albida]
MTGELVDKVTAGYTFGTPTLDLGALVDGGVGVPTAQVRIPLAVLNRHGLVAGATGTGKTKTLQLIAEQLSAAGVPVFLADIKGDVSGMAVPGETNDKLTARAAEIGQDWQPAGYPCEFYALGGQGTGIPVRATLTAFGPTLLAKVLGLSEVQESSLNLIFHFADKNGLPLLDLKDLRAVIQYLTGEEGGAALKELGGLSKQTAGVLLRELIGFADKGADQFFGEPEFETADLLRTAPDGRGLVSILELPGVITQPALFSTFLMWLVADLFETLPEVGDPEKPKLVFFFDEAHLLFKDASKAFLESITQTVRLIRSKGVGIFFVTQTPKDVPADVLAQLGNRVQHALRAYTPEDAKALKATVSTFPKSEYDLAEVLTTLGTGEAVVTVLSEKGAPTPVAWTKLRAPQSLMAPAPAETLESTVKGSPLYPKYAEPIDRESAYEKLAARVTTPAPSTEDKPKREPKPEPGMVEQVMGSSAVKSFLRSAASTIGREITRSIFGTAKRRR